MAEPLVIGDLRPRIQYAADGVQTVFTYPFPIFEAADLEVYLDAVPQETGFTVDGVGQSAGGSVTFAAAPAAGVTITLRRFLTIQRLTDFQEAGEFRASVLNLELDKVWAVLQQLDAALARSLRLSDTDTAAATTLPDGAARAGKAFTFDAGGAPAATEFAALPTAATYRDATPAAPTTAGAAGTAPNVARGHHVHPLPAVTGLATRTADTVGVPAASQAEAEAGTNNTKAMTALRTAQAIAALAPAQLGTFRNRIINGAAPFVNQRGAQTGMADGAYFVDRWRWNQAGAGVVDGDAVSDWVEVDVTTADATIAAGDVYHVSQRIEANNVADLGLGTAGAETVTLSFKHKHTKAGTYCVAFANAAGNRSYVAEYTQSVADAEETATVTLTLDTTGTWATGASTGIEVRFALAAGTTFQATAGSWQAGDFVATANQVNALDAATNFFRIRDLQLEIGSTATAFERRPFATEVALCQRYYEKSYDLGTAPGSATDAGAETFDIPSINAGTVFKMVAFTIPKRFPPMGTFYSPVTGASGNMRYNLAPPADHAVNATYLGEKGMSMIPPSSLPNGIFLAHWTVEAEL